MKLSLIFSLLCCIQTGFSAEADNFTARTLDLIDVSGQINNEANLFLKSAVDQANDQGTCDQAESEAILYRELKKYFANHSKGQLVKNILYTENIAKNALPLRESVYKDWSIRNGFLLGRKKAASSPLALSPLIQMGDQIIGVDKLEHMFGMGFIYFFQHYSEGKSIKKVLKSGIFKEKTFLGGNVLATGVFSYGDLAANFNGMRFWNHVLLKHDDILGSEHNLGPYVSCSNSKWKVESAIDFRNYIDASMDESINCSKFANRSGAKKFKKSLKRLNFISSDGKAMCPVEPEKLKEMKEKYRPSNISHFIINDEGTGTVSYFNEF